MRPMRPMRHDDGMRRRRRGLGLLVVLALLVSGVAGCSDPKPAVGTTTITIHDIDVNAIVRGPSLSKAKLVVLFLHGASYTSRIWADRGIIDAVTAQRYRAVAIDLPGRGDTHGELPADTDAARAEFLAAVVMRLGGPKRVVIVSPSFSGTYSLPYLARFPVRLAGYVPVAPVGAPAFERPAGDPTVPTMIVQGANDDVIPRSQMDLLHRRLPGSTFEVVPDAGHAAYDDGHEAFTKLLLAFLAAQAPIEDPAHP